MPLKTQGYTARGTGQVETHRGIAWSADLYHNGRKIGWCSNNGDGGQTRVMIDTDADHAAYAHAAKIACPKSYESHARFAERLMDVADGIDEDWD